MTIERLCSDKIEEEKTFARNPQATHYEVEKGKFVQYKCNPHPRREMRKFPDYVKGKFSIIEVKNFVYSFVVESKHYSTIL